MIRVRGTKILVTDAMLGRKGNIINGAVPQGDNTRLFISWQYARRDAIRIGAFGFWKRKGVL